LVRQQILRQVIQLLLLLLLMLVTKGERVKVPGPETGSSFIELKRKKRIRDLYYSEY
jgi:hypothetical protein